PLLSPLADNGGPTETMAVNAGSFAIDNGATGDSIPTTDQRGYGVSGATRDIGAFEYDGLVTTVKPLGTANVFSVYPNPSNSFIHVITGSGVTPYSITDLLGQTVLTGQLTVKDNTINTASLSADIYILKAGTRQFKLVKN